MAMNPLKLSYYLFQSPLSSGSFFSLARSTGFIVKKSAFLSLWLLLLSYTGKASAETHTLDSIDFSANNAQKTEIRLHTGSIVPVRKVHISPSKLILDIDDINLNGTVNTRFSEYNNISHVILEPLGEHRVRLVVRGENLAPPSIAFDRQASEDLLPSGESVHMISDPESVASSSQEERSLPFEEVAPPVKTRAVKKALKPDTLKAPDAILSLSDREPVQLLSPQATSSSRTTLSLLPQPGLKHPANSQSQPKEVTDNLFDTIRHAINPTEAWKPLSLILPILPYAVGFSMIIGILYFLQYKIRRYLAEGELETEQPQALQSPPWEEDYPTPKQLTNEEAPDVNPNKKTGKHATKASKPYLSFSPLAEMYRNQKISDQVNAPDKPSKANDKSRSKKEMIGLGGLGLSTRSEKTTTTPTTQKTRATLPTLQPKQAAEPGTDNPLMDLVAEIQKKNSVLSKKLPNSPKTPVKTAARQYQAQSPQTTKTGTKNNSLPETIRQERQLADQTQKNIFSQFQKPVRQNEPLTNRALAGQKKITPPSFQSVSPDLVVNRKKEPQQPDFSYRTTPDNSNRQPRKVATESNLPDNPEVLNFLRNVADLMEKEGNTTIAKSIQKNLNAPMKNILKGATD
jgi:hypothetical protein